MIIINIKGGIGNQCFQYALGRAIESRGKRVVYDISSFEGYNHAFRLDCFNTKLNIATKQEICSYNVNMNDLKFENNFDNSSKAFIHKVNRKIKKIYTNVMYVHEKIVIEKSFFDKRLFFIDNKYLDGYWANLNYFDKIKDLLTEELSLLSVHCDEKYRNITNKIEQSTIPYVSIHVRRGDYLSDSNKKLFYYLPPVYYHNALLYIKSKVGGMKVLIFSNDIEWCKIEFGQNYDYIDEKYNFTDYQQFEIMKLCHMNIIANSTYSWWAAYLNINPEKIVVIPKVWYNNKAMQKRFEKGSIIPYGWIVL